MKNNLYNYILGIADNSLILGQRLGQLCGHGPSLETDIACTNISLDLFGQVRSYFQYAAKIAGDERTEDDIAMLRKEREYKNVLLVEQPNTNFAYSIGRQFLSPGAPPNIRNSGIDSQPSTPGFGWLGHRQVVAWHQPGQGLHVPPWG